MKRCYEATCRAKVLTDKFRIGDRYFCSQVCMDFWKRLEARQELTLVIDGVRRKVVIP